MVNRRELLKTGFFGISASMMATLPAEAKILPPPIMLEGRRNLKWLRRALQAAIQVEFSTIPLYLCAAWSIIDDADPVKSMMLEIANDEMLHMGLACNMLVAIGGTPDLSSPAAVPVYPGCLPGGLRPDLEVVLRRLTPSAIDVFLAIENTHQPVVSTSVVEDKTRIGIADVYQAIRKAFKRIKPVLLPDRQVSGSLGLTVLTSLDAVDQAIDLIIQQGQGVPAASGSPAAANWGHYYRFAQMRQGTRLASQDQQSWGFQGEVLPFPTVYPMADIPAGGYRQQDVPAEVWDQISAFDRAYTLMLQKLQAAWTPDGTAALSESVQQMVVMTEIGKSLMTKPIDEANPGKGNYGPCFRLLA